MDNADGYDFAGYVTKNDVRCADGAVIRHDAFKDQDGERVPLVWMHQHGDIGNVLGNVLLQNRNDGVYGYGSLNDTEGADIARALIKHDDVMSMSIWANHLTRNGSDVLHGTIREVSLVLAGANPEARISEVLSHGDASEDDLYYFGGEDNKLIHADNSGSSDESHTKNVKSNTDDKEDTVSANASTGGSGEKTLQDIFDSMTEEQKNVVYAIVGQLAEDSGDSDDEEDAAVKHNVFDSDGYEDSRDDVLVHDAMNEIISDAKSGYSMKRVFDEYVADHQDDGVGDAISHAATYGAEPIDYLFPDAKSPNTTPEFIQRDTGWVTALMGSVHHTPFSRVKSVFANITADEARARGYLKGKLKKEEVFTLLKRSTTPTTVYKKQKMDRDDVVDITDFDVVAWLKSEMRTMLDEEIARAILIGDGRDTSDDDHIPEDHIRPIWKDAELYTINPVIELAGSETEDDIARTFIRSAIKARKDYKGSGNPTLFTTEDFLTNMLLLEDKMGRPLYDSVEKLATKLRVRAIVTVEVMENQTRSVDGKTHTLMGIIVNPADYNVGADRGGAVSMFDDFDIDYNQQKYLIETRCSGALIKPYSAIAVESVPKA